MSKICTMGVKKVTEPEGETIRIWLQHPASIHPAQSDYCGGYISVPPSVFPRFVEQLAFHLKHGGDGDFTSTLLLEGERT